MTDRYYFSGWTFRDNGRMLMLDVPIVNAHPPEAIFSYHTYGREFSRERAAAWLISHWYEHRLEVCPCIKEGDSDNNFRRAFIESILILEGKNATS